jgi:uncharacterized protein (UPF0276 family)
MPFADELLSRAPAAVRWLEVHPENYVRRGGRYAATLEACQRRWPIVTHGLTMGLGAASAVASDRMAELARFLDRVETPWHSDHIAFAEAGGLFAHDLLPVPWNRASLDAAVRRVREMRAAIGRPVLVENLTWYATFEESDRTETEFIVDLLDRTDGALLLDVNNVCVNACNHGFDAEAWLDAVPMERVAQIHVAGHLVGDDGLRIDTHAEEVCDAVYGLLERVLRRTGHVPVLLERDGNFVDLDAILAEVHRLDALYRRVLGDP